MPPNNKKVYLVVDDNEAYVCKERPPEDLLYFDIPENCSPFIVEIAVEELNDFIEYGVKGPETWKIMRNWIDTLLTA